ncbi:MAG TPA: signal peptidase II [Myxococcota bacterium]|nr:signal peptidase II [Myxococcota bacterium]
MIDNASNEIRSAQSIPQGIKEPADRRDTLARLMPSPARKSVYFSVAFALTYPLDQLTKWLVVERFAYGERLVVIPGFFNLTHVRNPGGAFSFFAQLPDTLRQVFFLGTGVLAIVLLLVFLTRLDPRERLTPTAIGAVLGGAIGNLTDRLVYGEVIDFLDFRLWGGYVWPTFNLADCWIVVGVGILMLEMFFDGDEPSAPEEAAPVSERPTAPGETRMSIEGRGAPPA